MLCKSQNRIHLCGILENPEAMIQPNLCQLHACMLARDLQRSAVLRLRATAAPGESLTTILHTCKGPMGYFRRPNGGGHAREKLGNVNEVNRILGHPAAWLFCCLAGYSLCNKGAGGLHGNYAHCMSQPWAVVQIAAGQFMPCTTALQVFLAACQQRWNFVSASPGSCCCLLEYAGLLADRMPVYDGDCIRLLAHLALENDNPLRCCVAAAAMYLLEAVWVQRKLSRTGSCQLYDPGGCWLAVAQAAGMGCSWGRSTGPVCCHLAVKGRCSRSR